MPPCDFASNSFSFGSGANSSNAAFEQGLQPNQERHETDIKKILHMGDNKSLDACGYQIKKSCIHFISIKNKINAVEVTMKSI